MRTHKTYPLLVLAVFFIMYIIPLGARPLIVPDETRYGEIPREMIASGNWIVPHLNGLRYFEKPALGYWLHAGSIMLFGENNFAVRFPSAMAAGLAALLIFWVMKNAGRKDDSDNKSQALLGMLVFLVCFEVAAVSTVSLLDSILTLFVTGTMTSFFLACESGRGSSREKLFLLLAGVFCGLAFLTKGFLTLVLPCLAIFPYLLWQRRLLEIFRLAWIPLLTAVAVALPWGILIHMQEPDFWNFFFWNEHVRRFLSGTAQHKKPFWYFLMIAPAAFLPWTPALASAITGIRQTLKQNLPASNLIRFCLCWLIFPFLFFSSSSGKLLPYILPCFPPFAILMTLGLKHTLNRGRSASFQFGTAVLGIIFAMLCLALIYAQVFGHKGVHLYSEAWKGSMVAASLASMAVLSISAVRSRKTENKIISLALAPVLLFFTLSYALPDRTLESKAPGPMLERHIQDITPDTIIISGKETLQAVCWYYRRDNVYMLETAGELEYGLQYDNASARLLDVAGAARLISLNPGRVVIIDRARNHSSRATGLPKPSLTDNSGAKGYIFLKY